MVGSNLGRSWGFAPGLFPGLRPRGEGVAGAAPSLYFVTWLSLHFCIIAVVLIASAGDEPWVQARHTLLTTYTVPLHFKYLGPPTVLFLSTCISLALSYQLNELRGNCASFFFFFLEISS